MGTGSTNQNQATQRSSHSKQGDLQLQVQLLDAVEFDILSVGIRGFLVPDVSSSQLRRGDSATPTLQWLDDDKGGRDRQPSSLAGTAAQLYSSGSVSM